MNTKAVSYIRVSTKKQKEISPDVQRQEILRYAERQDPPLSVVEEFAEERSGFKLNARIRFYEMLEYVQQQRIGHVLYYLTNRISRNIEDWQELKKANVRMHNVVKRRSFNLNDKHDWQAIIEEERDLIEGKKFSYETGFRVHESQVERAAQGGYPGPPPVGYIVNRRRLIDPAEPRYTLDPVRGPLIQQMFRLFASGTYTRRAITAKMKALGLRSLKDNVLHRSQVESYLKNPFYSGRFRWDGVECDNKGNWEPLISKALFDECQEVFSAKRSIQRRGPDYKYRGLLTCGLCGCAFIREAPTKRRKDGSKKAYGYYRCTFQRDKCYEKGSPRFTDAEMDALIESAIGMLKFDAKTYDWLKGQVEETTRLNRETSQAEAQRVRADLAKCEERRTKTWQLYLDGTFGDPAFIKEEFNRLSDQVNTLKARLASLDSQDTAAVTAALDILLVCNDFKNQYLTATPEKKRRLNHLLYYKISLHPLRRPKKELFADLEDAIIMDEFPLEIELNQPFADLYDLSRDEQLDKKSRTIWEQEKEQLQLRKKRMAPRAGLEPAT